jgi:hypothetical protein
MPDFIYTALRQTYFPNPSDKLITGKWRQEASVYALKVEEELD